MKKLFIICALIAGSLYASDVQAASTKKIDRAQILSSKAAIEITYNKSLQEAKTQFEADISSSKQLKGKAKSAAVKSAATKRQQALNKAKETRKKQLKELNLR
jgi:hypothetical protein